MPRIPNYDKTPVVPVGSTEECAVGWGAVVERLSGAPRICIECYPGTRVDELERELAARMMGCRLLRTDSAFKSREAIRELLEPHLGSDRVFGHMNQLAIEDWMDPGRLATLRNKIASAAAQGGIVVLGPGASLLLDQPRVLVYADMARWEIQARYRSGELGNLGCGNEESDFAEKYKCGFFAEWRAADRLKKMLLSQADFVLDTHTAEKPQMISGHAFRRALATVVARPFRVVPYFDPGPWGGEWMRRTFALPQDAPNFAWAFDCVPEENSLLLGFGECRVQVPAIDAVFLHPQELLGAQVYERFGAEFPIRFDLLDTVEGGNLSLQVHPLTGYIREQFGMDYTQDESYYMLHAEPDATVYLGLREGIDREAMVRDLRQAQAAGADFAAERYVNRFPVRRHDHVLIPAGTIHCSGRNGVVLEISATPYIFTFKLWDWGRMGLDRKPRPIHLEHGLANIQWDRTTGWVEKNLLNRMSAVAQGEGWREERTGLHELEFIETRRHWFTGPVPHDTGGGVNVLNLVEGEEAVVESPSGAFAPLVVHYAETFIVPAAVGPYTIRPHGRGAGTECATIKASVRAASA